jgi:hypothetical protein
MSNSVSVKTIDGVKSLTVCHENHQLSFILEKGEKEVGILELQTHNGNLMTFPTTLSLQYLESLLSLVLSRKNNIVLDMKTPMNSIMRLSKEECREIYEYLMDNK